MTGKPDRRVRKTRAILREGLEQLMREKSIQDITVKELCALCDLNRGTFYAHYSDVYDLLAAIEEELQTEFETVFEPLATADSFEKASQSSAMAGLFRFMGENAGMCRILLCDNGDMAFVQRVKDIVRARFFDAWHEQFSGGMRETSEYLYAFMVSGCIGILQQWLEHDRPVPPEQIALLVENLLTKGMEAFFCGNLKSGLDQGT
ncbi:MAG: TetR-like C-terminal domain-containing protein [Ruthenibacterium sp.]